MSLFKKRTPTEIELKLNYIFKNQKLLDTALTHISYANERGRKIDHNERFEFLGDAVLGLVITDMLMDKFVGCNEGELSKMRAIVVSRKILAQIAYKLHLGAYVKLSSSELSSGGREKESILANTYEALIAAIYFDGGLEKVRNVVKRHFEEPIKSVKEGRCEFEDYKSILQEVVQNKFKTTPSYEIVREIGPDHAKRFFSTVTVDNKKFGVGRGKSKKESEQDAARQTLIMLSFKRGTNKDDRRRGIGALPSETKDDGERIEFEGKESEGFSGHWFLRLFDKFFRKA